MPAESAARLWQRGKAPDFLKVRRLAGPGRTGRPSGSRARPRLAIPYFAPGITLGVQGVPTFCESVFMVICCPLVDIVIVPLE